MNYLCHFIKMISIIIKYYGDPTRYVQRDNYWNVPVEIMNWERGRQTALQIFYQSIPFALPAL